MKEHPILFSGEMVQAILEGRKVQTRRVIKPQPTYDTACGGHWYWLTGTWKSICIGCKTIEKFASWMLNPSVSLNHPRSRCPYGAPGDLLWVRETWAHWMTITDDVKAGDMPIEDALESVLYKADFTDEDWVGLHEDYEWTFKPSIFMPRWASRITLEVVSVRVERVQDISEADAYAEGIGLDPTLPHPLQWFKELWDTINAKRGGKKWLVEPWDLWLWGHDEHDDPESIALDVMDPGAIQWRNPEELGPDYKFRFFRDNQPPSDGYYEVIWEKGDLVEYVYLRRADPIEGDDYVKYDYSWSSNPWIWVVEFRQI